jgi:SagB-type dehydrogenase family enzyme
VTLPAPLEATWRTRNGPLPDGLLRPPTEGLRAAVAALPGGVAETSLDGDELPRFLFYMQRLGTAGLVVVDLVHDGRTLATLEPRAPAFMPRASRAETVVLSRFAYLRRVGDNLVLAEPSATCEVRLVDERARAWVTACACACPCDGPPERAALLAVLHGAGLLEDPGEPESEAQRMWEFHDRLFHRASLGYRDGVVRGATFRFRTELPSPPAVRPAYDAAAIALPVPARGAGRQLREVMDGRRSRREMAEQSVTRAEVGDLLYRVARTTEASAGHIRRPYPSGGSRHELEFYVAIRCCDGLEPGFYHYRGGAHELVAIGARAAAEGMLAGCARAWGQADRPPQALIVIASRLPRLAWKYGAIAYRVTLLNAGVALANLALVAEEIGLAGSPTGSHDPGLFAQATGADPWEEASVAEFGFGRRA